MNTDSLLIRLNTAKPPWMSEVLEAIMAIAREEEVELTEAARRLQKKKWKELYSIEKEEVERRFAWRIRKTAEEVAKGQASTKRIAGRMLERIAPSIITRIDSDGTEETVCDEEQVKRAYNEHFQTIFRRDKVPAEHGIQKPWLNSDKARHFRQEAEQNHMTWPPKIDETLVKTVLSRGTQTPSPGPDGCEKWCL